MKIKLHTTYLAIAFATCAIGSARADLIESVSFTLPVGPSQQTIQLPQFNPVLGTLTNADISVSGTIQYVLDVFNTGAGPFSVFVQDTLSFAGTPIMTGEVVSGTIPADRMVYNPPQTPLAFGPLVETIGPLSAGFLVGTGTVPFDLSLPAVSVSQVTGASVLNVLSFAAASGTVVVNYAFTPAVTPVPEPASVWLVGVALMALFRRRRK
jgi:hypothetical protein